MPSILVSIILSAGILLAGSAGAQPSTQPDGWPVVAATPYVHVPTGAADPLRYAIFRDFLPWGTDIDDQILMANGIAFTVFNGADIGLVDLASFDKVILSNQQGTSFITTVAANAGWFESYVEGGGVLLNGMAHFFDDMPVGTTYPGDYEYAAQNCNDAVVIIAAAHPIFNTPHVVPESALQGWECSSHGRLTPPGGNLTLLRNDDIDQGIAVGEVELGAGQVISTTQPYQITAADHDYAENLLLYLPGGVTPIAPITWGAIKTLYDQLEQPRARTPSPMSKRW